MDMVSAYVSPSFPLALRIPRYLTRKASWLLADGEHHPGSILTRIKAYLVNILSVHQASRIDDAVIDVVQELTKLVQQKTVSHVVIYGTGRMLVAAGVLLSKRIPDNIKLVLSENELQQEALIAETIDFRLPPETIKRLPYTLDFQESVAQGLPSDLSEALYANKRLVGPYQIDTDRYPFTDRFT